jgi:hypothetical protein
MGSAYQYRNEMFTLSSVISNVIRNVSLHVGTPSSAVNTLLEKSVYRLHNFIGLSPNDSRTTWTGTEFHIPKFSLDEGSSGNPIHLILIVLSSFLFAWRPHQNWYASRYQLSLLSAFLLFSFYLKWMPWHSRLHLPLFVLFSPFIGLVISREKNHRRINILMALLIMGASPWLFYNPARPMLGRNNVFITERAEQYFGQYRALAEPYKGAVQILSALQCSEIGLFIGGDSWEYPLWVLMPIQSSERSRFEHVNVTNVSRHKSNQFRLGKFRPCAIVAMHVSTPSELSVRNMHYTRIWSDSPISVYTYSQPH